MCALRLSEKRLIDRPSPLGQLDMNPGRFAPITCSPPLNRYYIIKDVVFFDNFLVIIYKFISCNLYAKKIIIHWNHSFWFTLIIYLLVVCKKNNHSFWSTMVKDLERNFSCKIYKKSHKNSKKIFFVPTLKFMK